MQQAHRASVQQERAGGRGGCQGAAFAVQAPHVRAPAAAAALQPVHGAHTARAQA